MNTLKYKPLLYDHLPRVKGKYKNDTAQMAVKRLTYIKHLRLTKVHEYSGWSLPGCSRSSKRLFKICKTFKTVFPVPCVLVRALIGSRIKRLSIYSSYKSVIALLKRVGNRQPLSKLSINLPENFTPRQLSTYMNILRKKFIISGLRFKFPKKPLYIPTDKEMTILVKKFSKIKDLNTLKVDTNFLAKAYLVKTLFKPMVTWNIIFLSLKVDLREIPSENLALALSNLASMRSLRGFETEWGYLEKDILPEETHMNEVAKSFQTFLKHQFKLNSLTFKHRSMQGTCSLAGVYKDIGKLKYLENLSIWPFSGDWDEKDMDAFIACLDGHPKLKRLELVLSQLPTTHTAQFYKKLNAGFRGIKKVEELTIVGIKIPGFVVEDPVGLKDIFKHLRKLEFSLLLQQNTVAEANNFAKLLSCCTKLETLVLGVNQNGAVNENVLKVILSSIENIETLTSLDLGLGRIKKEGNKNIFSSMIHKLKRLYAFRLKFGEAYFTDEELLALGEALTKKRVMRSVVIMGLFASNSKEVKDWFVMNLRIHGIKTPPLA